MEDPLQVTNVAVILQGEDVRAGGICYVEQVGNSAPKTCQMTVDMSLLLLNESPSSLRAVPRQLANEKGKRVAKCKGVVIDINTAMQRWYRVTHQCLSNVAPVGLFSSILGLSVAGAILTILVCSRLCCGWFWPFFTPESSWKFSLRLFRWASGVSGARERFVVSMSQGPPTLNAISLACWTVGGEATLLILRGIASRPLQTVCKARRCLHAPLRLLKSSHPQKPNQ